MNYNENYLGSTVMTNFDQFKYSISIQYSFIILFAIIYDKNIMYIAKYNKWLVT